MIPVWAWVLLGAVGLQRIAEMGIARRHTQKLLARGARIVEDDGYRPIVAVHVLFFAAFAAEAATSPWAGVRWWTWPLLGIFAVGQGLRYWTMRTLGDRWTTRVVVLPDAPLVEAGPFRLLRHPNYVGVALELLALPLAFGLVGTAVVLSGLNLLALRVRIGREEDALGIQAG